MKRSTRYLNRSAGFTLIELLIVIAIIGILAGIVYGAVALLPERAKKVKTLSYIKSIDTAMSMFREDFGHPPYNSKTAGSKTNDPEWIRLWLTGKDDDGEPDETGANAVRENGNWNGPYIDPDPKMLIPHEDYSNHYIMVDAWENPIYFEVEDPIFKYDRWDIWSKGSDEKGSEDMGAFSGSTYKEKQQAYKDHTEDGKKVNTDNPANWQ
jgi:prepilin-type N-terminal cleavage/methylation domain-containing protein